MLSLRGVRRKGDVSVRINFADMRFPGKKVQWHGWGSVDNFDRIMMYVVEWADLHAQYQGGP